MDKKEEKEINREQKKQLSKSNGEKSEKVKQSYEIKQKKGTQRTVINPPKRSTLEEIGNSVTHGVGALFAVVAFIFMLVYSTSPVEYFGASMYFFGQFTMFAVSCLYHSFRYGSAVKRLFRRFDYSCIYLLIGATFAPILLCYLGGRFGLLFFIIQWSIIAAGITLVGIFGPSKLRFIHIPLYLALGWCGLLILPTMIKNGDYFFLAFILGGGVIYSLGVIPFALKKKASHFIWHFFVLAGAAVQWIGVFNCIYLH